MAPCDLNAATSGRLTPGFSTDVDRLPLCKTTLWITFFEHRVKAVATEPWATMDA